MVFGNKYSYNDVRLFYAGTAANQGPGLTIGRALGFYDRPDPHHLHDYIESEIAPYASNTTNIISEHISVKVAGDDIPTAGAKGHYNFQPDPVLTGISQESYDHLYSNGTGWYSPSSLNASSPGDKHSLLNITIKLDPDGSGPTDRGLDATAGGGVVQRITGQIINIPSLGATRSDDPLETTSDDQETTSGGIVQQITGQIINIPSLGATRSGDPAGATRSGDPAETTSGGMIFGFGHIHIPSAAEIQARINLRTIRLDLADKQDKVRDWQTKVTQFQTNVWGSGPLAGQPKDPLGLLHAISRREYWIQKRDLVANGVAIQEATFVQNGWPLTVW